MPDELDKSSPRRLGAQARRHARSGRPHLVGVGLRVYPDGACERRHQPPEPAVNWMLG